MNKRNLILRLIFLVLIIILGMFIVVKFLINGQKEKLPIETYVEETQEEVTPSYKENLNLIYSSYSTKEIAEILKKSYNDVKLNFEYYLEYLENDLPVEKVQSFHGYTTPPESFSVSGNSIKLFVFELKNSEDINDFKKSIEEYRDNEIKTLESFYDEGLEKYLNRIYKSENPKNPYRDINIDYLNNSKIAVHDNFIVYIVANDNEEYILNQFERIFDSNVEPIERKIKIAGIVGQLMVIEEKTTVSSLDTDWENTNTNSDILLPSSNIMSVKSDVATNNIFYVKANGSNEIYKIHITTGTLLDDNIFEVGDIINVSFASRAYSNEYFELVAKKISLSTKKSIDINKQIEEEINVSEKSSEEINNEEDNGE